MTFLYLWCAAVSLVVIGTGVAMHLRARRANDPNRGE